MDNRERTGKVEHGEGGVTIKKIFPDYGDKPEPDADSDKDQGRSTEEPKEPAQRQQIFPED